MVSPKIVSFMAVGAPLGKTIRRPLEGCRPCQTSHSNDRSWFADVGGPGSRTFPASVDPPSDPGAEGRIAMSSASLAKRQLPAGAEPLGKGAVSFRVWAPKRGRVRVALEGAAAGAAHDLDSEGDGYFSTTVRGIEAGALYRFLLDDEPTPFPDPASRFQPDGPHGPSEVIDPRAYAWTDDAWPGVKRDGHVIYELHIGTFTREGTFLSACDRLGDLAELGATLLEVMPVADFPGRFGWGYDGVDLYAPSHLYGRPDDLRAFVDRAHGYGLGVILDVVYNHLGPDGNFLRAFSDAYFTDRYENEWGDALNYDGPECRPVRDFMLANARYWVEEFHVDGLRLDATQSIFDSSHPHLLAEIADAVRRAAAPRGAYVVAENEPQDARLARPREAGGYGLDSLWNDDFHHSATVALTGRREAYYTDYLGAPQEFVSMARHGFLYQGQRYKWQKKRRGTPALDLDPCAFVAFLENHDQVANSPRGERLHRRTSAGRLRAATALLLLGPETPMLFQGQEFAASAPFLYFADQKPELARTVTAGRREFLGQFPSIATREMQDKLAEPSDPQTFVACKLDWGERERNSEIVKLHRDLIRHRVGDAVLSRCGVGRTVEGAVLGPEAFLLRYLDSELGRDRLLLVNLGADLHLDPAPQPLLAAPANRRWAMLWSSEDPAYGGGGTPAPEGPDNWRIPGQAALLLEAIEEDAGANGTAAERLG
jgi:maltooligosyltrehalose trehalohydrolase